MTIENGKIKVNGQFIKIGMEFEKVEETVNDVIYLKAAPNKRGLGHIMIRNESFYDLYGSVTMYFQEGRLHQIAISPEWNKYNLTNPDGSRMKPDKAVGMVVAMNMEGLKKAFGPGLIETFGSEEPHYWHVQGLYIFLDRPRKDNCLYSVVIGK